MIRRTTFMLLATFLYGFLWNKRGEKLEKHFTAGDIAKIIHECGGLEDAKKNQEVTLLTRRVLLTRSKGRPVRRKSFHRSTFVRHLIDGKASRLNADTLISAAAKFCIMKGFYAHMPVVNESRGDSQADSKLSYSLIS